MELFTALLLSLPGSPVLYYGDEIGMGDNIWLGDRDGVRTPMQWTPDRNAGFSSGQPGPAAPAADPGPGLRLPARQRRDRAGERLVAAALDPADDPRAQASTRRSASATSPTSAAPTRACSATCASTSPHDGIATDTRALREQPVPLPAARRARPAPLRGRRAHRAARRRAVPGDRRAALPPDARRLRLLLVPAAAAPEHGHAGRRGDRA